MKILLLVGGSLMAPYDKFLQAQKETFGKVQHADIETIFFHAGPRGWTDDYTYETDCNPGDFFQHVKFKRALEAIWEKDWDIMFRAHSSSYIDKAMLYDVCQALKTKGLYAGVKIGGPHLPMIEWRGGFIDQVKQEAISGAGIFLSRDTAEILKRELPEGENIEEDVLAGRILQSFGINPQGGGISRVDIRTMSDYRVNFHYRFKTVNRMQDIANMKKVHALHI